MPTPHAPTPRRVRSGALLAATASLLGALPAVADAQAALVWRADGAAETIHFAQPGRQDWQMQALHLAARAPEAGWSAGAGVTRTRRHGRTVDEWGLDGSRRIGDDRLVEAYAAGAPADTWRPRLTLGGMLHQDQPLAGDGPFNRWRWGLGPRLERVATGTSTSLDLGLQAAARGGHELQLALRATRHPGGASAVGGSLAGTAALRPDMTLRLALGRSSELDGQRWIPVRNAGLAWGWTPRDGLMLRLALGHEDRPDLGRSRSVGAALAAWF